MNLLEHYIKEIHSVSDITDFWNADMIADNRSDLVIGFDEPRMLEVNMTVTCYGVTERVKYWYRETQWNAIKEQGYYMA